MQIIIYRTVDTIDTLGLGLC